MQQSLQHLAGGEGGHVVRFELHARAEHVANERFAVLFGEHTSTVEDVDQRGLGVIGRLITRDHVARQPDHPHVQSGAPGDLRIDDRECDRDAGALGEHDVQVEVARVVVMIRVAAEPEFRIEQLVERLHGTERGSRTVGVALEAARERLRHVVEAPIEGVDVDIDILGAGRNQCGARERNGVSGTGGRLLEAGERVLEGAHCGGWSRAGVKPSKRRIFNAVTVSNSRTPMSFTVGTSCEYVSTGISSMPSTPAMRRDRTSG